MKVATDNTELDRAILRRHPRPPDRFPAVIARVIGFTDLLCGLHVLPEANISRARQSETVREAIVAAELRWRGLRQEQLDGAHLDAAGRGPIPVHCNLVGPTGNRREHHHAAGPRIQRIGVFVLGHEGQRRQVAARVNGQNCVEGTVARRDDDRTVEARGPSPPQGMAADVVPVVGFSRLLAGADVGSGDSVGLPRQGDAFGEIVIKNAGRVEV